MSTQTLAERPPEISDARDDAAQATHSPKAPPILAAAKPSAQKVYRRLLGYLLRHRVNLSLGLLCGILVGVVNGAFFSQIRRFINSLTKSDGHTLLTACILVVVLYAVMGVLKYGQSVLLATVAQRVGLDMRRDVYAHLQSLSLSYFHRRRTGALMSTLQSDVPKLQNAAMMLKDVVATPAQGIIYLVMMFAISWQLTLFSLAVIPIMAFLIQRLTRRLRGISRQTQERMADAAAVMEETLAAPRIVRAFSAEAHEIKRFERENRRVVDSQLRAVRRSARLGPIVDLMGAVGIAAALYYGGFLVIHKQLDTGGLIMFLGLVSQAANCVNAMGSLKSGWEEMMGAADRIFANVLDVTPEIRNAPDAKPLPPIRGRVEYRGVTFAYEPDQPVLSDINLVIEPGQMVAFVGETGAGKTTMVDLVPRFYDPTSGAILVDGQDIRAVTMESLRRQIGIVPQEALLLSGSIRDNIAYGKRDATEEEVRAAARAANAANFIEALPSAYETWVGERGATLSGGQRQRVAIARALLADPRILILDEATSALDAATEALVQEALETLMHGRTTLVIAHRLSTIIHADKIVVLKRGGRIAEIGTHHELMARGGVYAALFESQRRSTEIVAVPAVVRDAAMTPVTATQLAEEIRPPTLKERFLARLLALTVRALCSTLRVTVEGEEEAMAALNEHNGGFLICWHGRTLIPTDRFRGRGYGTLISLSRDGSLMAQYQRNLGMKTIRGSTKRRGVLAAREVLTFVDNGGVMLLTPDGPRGPSHVVQPGVVFLAKKSGKPIIAGGIAAAPSWNSNSWDRYQIPKPFARVHFIFGSPFFVAPAESLEAAAERLAAVMDELEARAEKEV